MRQKIAAVLILLGSAWLRFSHLGVQGVYALDEMYLAEHARNFASFLRAAAAGGPALYAEVARTGGLWHVTAAKPTQYAAMTIAALIGGDGDLPLLAVSALSGVALVILLFVWGRRWSRSAGLCAAALLGGLGGHVWYSRSLLAAAPASFFLTLGAYLYLRDEKPSPNAALGAGFSLGAAISTHYNVLPAAAAIIAYAALRRDWRGAGRLALGTLMPLLLWETAFALRNAWSAHPLLDHFGELRRYLFETSRRGPGGVWTPSLMTRWLILSSGAPATALLAVGGAAAARLPGKKFKPSSLLLIAALGPGMLLFWSVASLWWAQVARPVANLLPFMCLCAGIGWARLADALDSRGLVPRGWAPTLLPLALFAAGLPNALDFRLSVSPYKRVGAFLEANPGPVVAWNPILKLYAPDVPFVDAAANSGVARYVVADMRAPSGPDFGAPLLVMPFSRFDPRLLCLEESERPDACLRGDPPFMDRVAVFAGGAPK